MQRYLSTNALSTRHPVLAERWGLVGGGFALYGYLPALAKAGASNILADARYRNIVAARPELIPYENLIEWVSSREKLMKQAQSLILAVPPGVQESIIASLTSTKKYAHIILEKPLAPCPSAAERTLTLSVRGADVIRIGYNFPYLKWAERLKQGLISGSERNYAVNWSFLAKHFGASAPSWKSIKSDGGGILRFYGIHVIALLASLGRWNVDSSTIKSNSAQIEFAWKARFTERSGKSVAIDINSCANENLFEVLAATESSRSLTKLTTPFDELGASDGEDHRIPVLLKIIESVDQPNIGFYNFYSEVNRLWSQIEHCTVSMSAN